MLLHVESSVKIAKPFPGFFTKGPDSQALTSEVENLSAKFENLTKSVELQLEALADQISHGMYLIFSRIQQSSPNICF